MPVQIDGSHYLTTQEAAARLGIAPATLRNARSDGRSRIPALKLGASVLYRERDVERAAVDRGR